jgi:hypothetical protein
MNPSLWSKCTICVLLNHTSRTEKQKFMHRKEKTQMWNNKKLVTKGNQRRIRRLYSLPESFTGESTRNREQTHVKHPSSTLWANEKSTTVIELTRNQKAWRLRGRLKTLWRRTRRGRLKTENLRDGDWTYGEMVRDGEKLLLFIFLQWLTFFFCVNFFLFIFLLITFNFIFWIEWSSNVLKWDIFLSF